MKILEIDSCFDCKHIWRDTVQHCDYCGLIKGKPFDAGVDGIPGWCPLEDAILTSAMHSERQKAAASINKV